jgi:pyruvate,water dikinase
VAEARVRAGDHVTVALEPTDPPYDVGLVGGKAAGLFGAFPVLPTGCRIAPGFIVTTVAYRLHLLGETEDRLRDAVRGQDDDVAIERRARAAILAAEIPDEVEEQVRREVIALGEVPLAVRSSASVEDGPSGSLAGQFDTWLGVRGPEAVLDRLRWCWASLWNARALRTLAAAGRSPLDAAQAVLIQPVVRTRAAGVLISRDPSGRPDTLLVNAAWGLGEGVSQGETPGDLYWVRRSDGTEIASDPSDAGVRVVLDPDRPGTVEERLPPALTGRPCLDADDLVRLAAVARALEGAAGRAQDVEFGFDRDGSLVVFQVRRLVASPPRDDVDPAG